MKHENLLNEVENQIENVWETKLLYAAEIQPLVTDTEATRRRIEATNRKARPLALSYYLYSIFEKNGWRIHYINGMFHLYNGEFWKKLDPSAIKIFLRHSIQCAGMKPVTYLQQKFQNELYETFRENSVKHPRIPENPDVKINMESNTFCLDDNCQMSLQGFKRKDWLYYKLEFDYDKNATAPKFEKFLNEVLPDKSMQDVLAEYIAYCLMPSNYLNFEKVMMLHGSGANGKSVFYEVIRNVLGKENTSSVSLTQLTSDKDYYKVMLENKFLNYSSETGSMEQIALIKQLASGEPVSVNEKYLPPREMFNYAKLLFNTNVIPHFSEKNEAIKRRFFIMPFTITIPPEKRNLNLAKEIIQDEKPGIFNWILMGLNRLILNKSFSASYTLDEYSNTQIKKDDSVYQFLIDTKAEKGVGYKMPSQVFYDAYSTYCQRFGYKPKNQKNFAETIETEGYEKKRYKSGMMWDMRAMIDNTWMGN